MWGLPKQPTHAPSPIATSGSHPGKSTRFRTPLLASYELAFNIGTEYCTLPHHSIVPPLPYVHVSDRPHVLRSEPYYSVQNQVGSVCAHLPTIGVLAFLDSSFFLAANPSYLLTSDEKCS